MKKYMKLSNAFTQKIRIAVVEEDSLRMIGFRVILESEPDFDLIPVLSAETLIHSSFNLVLLSDNRGTNLVSRISTMRGIRPTLPIIVIGHGKDDEVILKAISSGAKGYVSDRAEPAELAQAIRIVAGGSVWAPRRVLSTFIERSIVQRSSAVLGGLGPLTDREKEVLKMLVKGLSNKEIGAPLGIVERTVKAHIATMMRKTGVQNRIALSVHAVTHSLVRRPGSNAKTNTEKRSYDDTL